MFRKKSELNPLSLYAKCKIECEKTISSFKSKDFCPVILRLATVYGDSPRKRFDLVVNRFTVMAIQKLRLNSLVQTRGDHSFQFKMFQEQY